MSHFSFSQLSEFSRCSKAYQLRRKQGVPSKPAAWLVGGSAVHAAIEAVNLSHLKGEEVDVNATWNDAWTGTLAEFLAKHPDTSEYRAAGRKTKDDPKGQDLDWWSTNGLSHVQAWADWLYASNWKIASFDGVPAVEFDIGGMWGLGDDTYEVKGFVDAVLQQPDGSFVMTDFKTGSRPVSSTQQMGLYVCSMERLGLPRPSIGGYFMTKTGQFGSFFDLSMYTENYFDSLFSRLGEAVFQNLYLPSLGDNCRMCDVAHACFANNGPEAFLYDPDHPLYSRKEQVA